MRLTPPLRQVPASISADLFACPRRAVEIILIDHDDELSRGVQAESAARFRPMTSAILSTARRTPTRAALAVGLPSATASSS